MTSSFSITPTPPTMVKLAPGEDGVFSFTVTSLSAPDRSAKVLFEALLIGPDGKGKEVDWLVVGPPRTMTMIGGETETVTITAKPTSSSPRGENTIKLAVAEEDRPHDAYGYSAPVICEVTRRVEPPPPPPRPKWLIPAIIAGVVVLAGGGILIWKLASSRGGCDEGASKPCTLASCSGVQRCTAGEWGACVADDPSCATRPANDNFAFAQALSGFSTTASGSTSQATREPNEPDHYTTGDQLDTAAWVGDHTVWYKWTAPSGSPQSITVDVCATELDSILAVYQGSSLTALTKVADNNNACGAGWGSKVSFAPMPNVTYYFAVGDAGGAREGAFTLKLH